LSENKYILRNVSHDDIKLLFEWINQRSVRRWSFSKELISYEMHQKWFFEKFKNKNSFIFILQKSSLPLGMIRFDKKNKKTFLSYLISERFRGQKLGTKILKLGISKISSLWGITDIYAETIPENQPSVRSLERVGFKLVSSNNKKKIYSLDNF
jgi:RimJ/RimL family protein N-acetyltransferase